MSEKKIFSTYEEFTQDPVQKRLLDKEYQELLLSELFLALMGDDQVSVRCLAKAAGVSPTIVQELRTGKKDNLTLKTFLSLIDSLGYSMILKKIPKPVRRRIGRKRKHIRVHLTSRSSLGRKRRHARRNVLR